MRTPMAGNANLSGKWRKSFFTLNASMMLICDSNVIKEARENKFVNPSNWRGRSKISRTSSEIMAHSLDLLSPGVTTGTDKQEYGKGLTNPSNLWLAQLVIHLPWRGSDNYSMAVQLQQHRNRQSSPFRLERFWLSYDGAGEVVSRAWSG